MDTINKPFLLLAFIVWICYPVYAQTCSEEDFVIVNEDKEYLRINSSGVFGCDLNLCNGVQSLSINNGEISISNGNTLNLPDPSPTNEIQELSVTNGGSTLSISNGNSVDLNPAMLRVKVTTTLGPYAAAEIPVLFDQITIDTENGYKTTGIYTVKTPGWYQVSGSLTISITNAGPLTLGFFVNGVSSHGCLLSYYQCCNIFGGYCSDLMKLNTNDTLNVRVTGTSISNLNINNPSVFTLHKISN